jgi:hypothetical protein
MKRIQLQKCFSSINSLIRTVQLGVLLKGAKAYTEAVKVYNEVVY